MKSPFRTQLQNSIFLIAFPLVYIMLGALMLFLGEKVNPSILICVVAACLVVAGIVMIARYFLQNSFRDLYSYDFSIGTFAVILGVCMIVGSESLEGGVLTLFGVFMLMTSIVKVQNSIQLITFRNKMWIPVMIVAVLLITADVLVLVNPFDDTEVYKAYVYWLLMVDGVLSLANNIFMHVVAWKQKKAAMELVDGVPAVGNAAPAKQLKQKSQDKLAEKSEKKDRANQEPSAKPSASAEQPVADKPAEKSSAAKSAEDAAGTPAPADDQIKNIWDGKDANSERQ